MGIVSMMIRGRGKLLSALRKSSTVASQGSSDSHVHRPSPWQMDNLTDIGSRHIFNEEHDTMREQFRKFWRSIERERCDKWVEQGFVDKEFWKEVGAQGMIGIETPIEKGGWGGDFIQHVIATEEQGYARVPGNFLLQSDMVLPYVAHNGTDGQVEKYAKRMRDGECVGAIAMTEPHAGSDLQAMKTYAKRDGDDWILNGSKVFITNGYIADTVLVCAITDRDNLRAYLRVRQQPNGFRKAAHQEPG